MLKNAVHPTLEKQYWIYALFLPVPAQHRCMGMDIQAES